MISQIWTKWFPVTKVSLDFITCETSSFLLMFFSVVHKKIEFLKLKKLKQNSLLFVCKKNKKYKYLNIYPKQQVKWQFWVCDSDKEH